MRYQLPGTVIVVTAHCAVTLTTARNIDICRVAANVANHKYIFSTDVIVLTVQKQIYDERVKKNKNCDMKRNPRSVLAVVSNRYRLNLIGKHDAKKGS